MKEKSKSFPKVSDKNSNFVEIFGELFERLFVYESKNRMTFMELCKHQLFLKVKNFNMEESVLFYFQAEKKITATTSIPLNL